MKGQKYFCLLLAALLAVTCLHLAQADETAGADNDVAAVLDLLGANPQKNIADANEAIKAAGNDRDKLIVAYDKRAKALRDMQQFEQAVADYGKVIELASQTPVRENYVSLPAFYRGQIERDQFEQYDKAIADFTKALEGQADWRDALVERAKSRYGKGDLEGARADLQKAIDLKKGKFDPPVFTPAMAALNKKLYQHPDDAEVLRLRGVEHLRNSRSGSARAEEAEFALRDITRAVQGNPQSAQARMDLGLIKMVLAGSAWQRRFSEEDINGEFDKAQALDSNYMPVFAARAFYQIASAPAWRAVDEKNDPFGQIKAQNSQHDQHFITAFDLLNKAAVQQPNGAEWPMLMALAERSRPEPDAAKIRDYYTRAAALSPRGLPEEITLLWPDAAAPSGDQSFKAKMLGERALVYASTGDYDHALTDLGDSLKLEDNASRRLLRARIYVTTGKWDDAITDAEGTLNNTIAPLDPSERVEALFTRAMVYDHKNQVDKAQADIDAMLQIDPSSVAKIKGSRYDKTN
jgi:tetratricopeptide (TPR) repeat protein